MRPHSLKYIITADEEVIIFPATKAHSEIASRMGLYRSNLLSAGSELEVAGRDIHFRHGSETLKIPFQKERIQADAEIIGRYLFKK